MVSDGYNEVTNKENKEQKKRKEDNPPETA